MKNLDGLLLLMDKIVLVLIYQSTLMYPYKKKNSIANIKFLRFVRLRDRNILHFFYMAMQLALF